MGDPGIVVEDRKELTYLLCQGAELEHGLLCQYLYAAFSLKNTAGPGLREAARFLRDQPMAGMSVITPSPAGIRSG
jgi:hypothetical protein